MKKLLWVLFAIWLFFFIVAKSETIEVIGGSESRVPGADYITHKYVWHWDRFFDYVIQTPFRIEKWAAPLLAKLKP